VRGTLVDARTGAPVEGAALLTLQELGVVNDPERLARHRDIGRMFEEDVAEDRSRLRFFPLVGTAHTDSLGTFELFVGLSTCVRTGTSGLIWNRERASAFSVVRALLVEREGYEPLVHATGNARWVEHSGGAIVGTLDVGTIRLIPR